MPRRLCAGWKSHSLLRWIEVEHPVGILSEEQPHGRPLLRLRERGSVRLGGGDALPATLEAGQRGVRVPLREHGSAPRSHLRQPIRRTLYAHGEPAGGLRELPPDVPDLSQRTQPEDRLLLPVPLLHVREGRGKSGGVRKTRLDDDDRHVEQVQGQLKQIRDYWSPGNRVAGAYNHHRRNAGGLSGDLLGHGCEVPVRGHRHRRREADDGQRLWGEWVYDHHRATANNDNQRRRAFCLRHDELHGSLWISGSRCPNYRTRFRLGL